MDILGLTVVITGASSGNGRALALALARSGANVVLAARREALLREVAEACEGFGVRTLVVPTDVSKDSEVRHLYAQALLAFGSIDVWVNNAGVLAMGEYGETSWAICKRVMATNLLGSMHAAHLVVPHFIEQGGGMLIHMNSLSAFIPTPHVVAYSASKIGLRGFSEALRYELSSYKEIHVSDVFATFLDSTGMDHAANVTGHKLAPPPPVLDPCDVAEEILKLIQRPKPFVHLGAASPLGRFARAVAPETLGVLMDRLTRFALGRSPVEQQKDGNILASMRSGSGIHGGWKGLGILRRLREHRDTGSKS